MSPVRLAAFPLLFLSVPAWADPVVLPSGPVVLPLSGLSIDLPRDPRPGFEWRLTASFSVDGGYDGRDVVDEVVDDKVVAGTWVHLGYFTAGDCRATVAEAPLAEPWTDTRELFGTKFEVRGGLYTFDNELGTVPAVVLCAHRDGRKDLLLYRFFVDSPADRDHESLLAALPRVAALEQATRAWQKDAWKQAFPLRRPEVRRRGTVVPVRDVRLVNTGLTLTLPDDGFIWTARVDPSEDPVDWLDRMAPSLNEVTLEIARVPGVTCEAVFAALEGDRHPEMLASGLPSGWVAGPTLGSGDEIEWTACDPSAGEALVVGVFFVPPHGAAAGDFAPLRPMLDAIAAARR